MNPPLVDRKQKPPPPTGRRGLQTTSGCAQAAYPDLRSGKLIIFSIVRFVLSSMCFSSTHKKALPGAWPGRAAGSPGFCRVYPKRQWPSLQARESFLDLEHLDRAIMRMFSPLRWRHYTGISRYVKSRRRGCASPRARSGHPCSGLPGSTACPATWFCALSHCARRWH